MGRGLEDGERERVERGEEKVNSVQKKLEEDWGGERKLQKVNDKLEEIHHTK